MPRTGSQRTKSRKKAVKKSKVVKKVTKKGAYNKHVKNQMSMRRAPIVETKQRVHSDIAFINGYPAGSGVLNSVNPLNWRPLVVDDAFTLLPLKSYYRNTHGFQDYNVIGNNIFSKYLNMKCQLRFPDGKPITLPRPHHEGDVYTPQNRMIQDPTKVYLICGWITQHMNYPIDNDPTPSLPAQSDADGNAINNYITQQLKPYFDDDVDKLQFRPKETTNIKIEKYVQFKPRIETAIGTKAVPIHTMTYDGTASGSGVASAQDSNYGPNPLNAGANPGNVKSITLAHGSIPEVSKSHSWKCMKKISLTEGAEVGYPVDKQNLYPNNSWIPFAVIYNPNYEQQLNNMIPDPDNQDEYLSVQLMEYRWNDCHYFTDS